MRVKIHCIILSIIIIHITSCGGGSGGKNNNVDSNDRGSSNSTDELNPELEGKLFHYDSQRGPAYFFEFKTGSSEAIPQTNWLSDQERFPSSVTDFSVDPTLDGEQWVLGSKECALFLGAGGCLYLQDKFGNYTGPHLDFDARVDSVFLSSDKKYILLTGSQIGGNEVWKYIYDFDGQLYDQLNIKNAEVSWFADNRFVFVDFERDRRSFQFTSPLSFDVEYKLQLPETVVGGGLIGGFSVSPDNTHIAFYLFSEGESIKRSIWVLSVDTGALNRFAQIGQSYDSISRPRWSPAGNYIAVLSGGKPDTEDLPDGGIGPGTPIFELEDKHNSLFIIPTDQMMEKTYVISKESDKSPEVIKIKQKIKDSNEVTTAFPDIGNFNWVE